jgi:BMFP domain-containing protein YqiC
VTALVRATRVLALAALVALAGVAACSKPDWVDQLDKRLQKAVPELEAALDRLASDIPRLENRANQALQNNIALLNRLLRENVDGINQILTENRERLDAALIARVEQLARFAQQLDANVTAIVAHTVDHVTVSVDELIAQTDLASRALLSSLDLQIARVRDTNGETVASVYSAGNDLAVRVVGGVLVILGIAVGGAFYLIYVRRQTPGQTWILPTATSTAVLGVGLLLLLSQGLRSQLFASDLIIQRSNCPDALRAADAWVVGNGHASPLSPDAVTGAPTVMSGLLTCEAVASARPQYDSAVDRVADIRRVLGISKPCADDGECPAGHWCDVVSSTCTDQCRHDNECPAAQLCHSDGGFCRAPCSATAPCPTGFTCNGSGRCARSVRILPGTLRIRGGAGWDLSARCGRATVCLRANPALRVVLRPDSP